jgi:hypothetical protein
MTAARRLCLVAVAVAAAGCASSGAGLAQGIGVADGAYQMDQLYFGRAIGDTGLVSDSAWAAFAGEVVTPRFPDGFTSWRAEGQWRGANGVIVREPSVVLEIVHRPTAADDSAIVVIAAEYKRRFHQEAVLRLTSAVRATF